MQYLLVLLKLYELLLMQSDETEAQQAAPFQHEFHTESQHLFDTSHAMQIQRNRYKQQTTQDHFLEIKRSKEVIDRIVIITTTVGFVSVLSVFRRLIRSTKLLLHRWAV